MTVLFDAQKPATKVAFAAADGSLKASLESSDRALGKAENATEKNSEKDIEFRLQLREQDAMLMPRSKVQKTVKLYRELIGGVLVYSAGNSTVRKVWVTRSTNWWEQAFEKQGNDFIVTEDTQVVALQLESFNAIFAGR
jgi:hypothetical protein